MYDIQKKGADYQEKPIVFVGMIEQTKNPKKNWEFLEALCLLGMMEITPV